MLDPISSLRPLAAPESGVRSAGGFQQALEQAIERVESAQRDAAGEVTRFGGGESDELHKLALAVQRADTALALGLQIRNKVVEAYQEIMRMQM